ncbi:hypothetical protein AAG570_007201 [Ranatra chinensis]|uniref:Uncharacterized protein n=1 Tax=Ranatra chinensis TaxID=642074 RepID=A0ABD0XX32_9HEMI
MMSPTGGESPGKFFAYGGPQEALRSLEPLTCDYQNREIMSYKVKVESPTLCSLTVTKMSPTVPRNPSTENVMKYKGCESMEQHPTHLRDALVGTVEGVTAGRGTAAPYYNSTRHAYVMPSRGHDSGQGHSGPLLQQHPTYLRDALVGTVEGVTAGRGTAAPYYNSTRHTYVMPSRGHDSGQGHSGPLLQQHPTRLRDALVGTVEGVTAGRDTAAPYYNSTRHTYVMPSRGHDSGQGHSGPLLQQHPTHLRDALVGTVEGTTAGRGTAAPYYNSTRHTYVMPSRGRDSGQGHSGPLLQQHPTHLRDALVGTVEGVTAGRDTAAPYYNSTRHAYVMPSRGHDSGQGHSGPLLQQHPTHLRDALVGTVEGVTAGRGTAAPYYNSTRHTYVMPSRGRDSGQGHSGPLLQQHPTHLRDALVGTVEGVTAGRGTAAPYYNSTRHTYVMPSRGHDSGQGHSGPLLQQHPTHLRDALVGTVEGTTAGRGTAAPTTTAPDTPTRGHDSGQGHSGPLLQQHPTHLRDALVGTVEGTTAGRGTAAPTTTAPDTPTRGHDSGQGHSGPLLQQHPTHLRDALVGTVEGTTAGRGTAAPYYNSTRHTYVMPSRGRDSGQGHSGPLLQQHPTQLRDALVGTVEGVTAGRDTAAPYYNSTRHTYVMPSRGHDSGQGHSGPLLQQHPTHLRDALVGTVEGVTAGRGTAAPYYNSTRHTYVMPSRGRDSGQGHSGPLLQQHPTHLRDALVGTVEGVTAGRGTAAPYYNSTRHTYVMPSRGRDSGQGHSGPVLQQHPTHLRDALVGTVEGVTAGRDTAAPYYNSTRHTYVMPSRGRDSGQGHSGPLLQQHPTQLRDALVGTVEGVTAGRGTAAPYYNSTRHTYVMPSRGRDSGQGHSGPLLQQHPTQLRDALVGTVEGTTAGRGTAAPYYNSTRHTYVMPSRGRDSGQGHSGPLLQQHPTHLRDALVGTVEGVTAGRGTAAPTTTAPDTPTRGRDSGQGHSGPLLQQHPTHLRDALVGTVEGVTAGRGTAAPTTTAPDTPT